MDLTQSPNNFITTTTSPIESKKKSKIMNNLVNSLHAVHINDDNEAKTAAVKSQLEVEVHHQITFLDSKPIYLGKSG